MKRIIAHAPYSFLGFRQLSCGRRGHQAGDRAKSFGCGFVQLLATCAPLNRDTMLVVYALAIRQAIVLTENLDCGEFPICLILVCFRTLIRCCDARHQPSSASLIRHSISTGEARWRSFGNRGVGDASASAADFESPATSSQSPILGYVDFRSLDSLDATRCDPADGNRGEAINSSAFPQRSRQTKVPSSLFSQKSE